MRVIENTSVDPVASAGAVWSSVSDMAKWMQFLLDGGRIGGSGGKRCSRSHVRRAVQAADDRAADIYPTRAAQAAVDDLRARLVSAGLRGRAVDFHTGSIDGMVAIHGLIRDERLGVYVLANLDHAELRHALM